MGTVTSGEEAKVTANPTETGVSLDFVVPIGAKGETGEQGPQGEKGDTGATGATPTVDVGTVTSGEEAKVTANPTETGVSLDFVVPIGAKGEPGEQGPQGDKGDTGATGATPTVDVGTVTSGEEAKVTANPTETGVSLDFVVPIGAKGETGEQGPQGEKGDTGEQGPAGETPVITVSEDTPTSYKLNIKTPDTDITTPNLYAPLNSYHVDLSALNSTFNITLGNLILTYQTTSTTSVRISVSPLDSQTPILTDMRRTTIYGGGTTEATTLNNTTVSARTVLDDLMYTQSQEEHSMKIRQMDPKTQLWSLCEIRSFISNGAARTSIWIKWIESEVSYLAP